MVGVVSENDDGSLYMTLSEIYQDTSGFGAADPDTPYIIEGCRIRLPQGGDWILSEEGGTLFDIYSGTDEEGVTYIDAYPLEGAPEDQILEETLILKSEALGMTQRLKYRTNEIGEGELLPEDVE